jgi:hypothetical protein
MLTWHIAGCMQSNIAQNESLELKMDTNTYAFSQKVDTFCDLPILNDSHTCQSLDAMNEHFDAGRRGSSGSIDNYLC